MNINSLTCLNRKGSQACQKWMTITNISIQRKQADDPKDIGNSGNR